MFLIEEGDPKPKKGKRKRGTHASPLAQKGVAYWKIHPRVKGGWEEEYLGTTGSSSVIQAAQRGWGKV